MQKGFYSIKENKCSFLTFRGIKVKKVSPGNGTSSLLMLLLRSGWATSNLLLMLRPCFAWLLFIPTPPSNGARMTESDSRRHQAALAARLQVTRTTCRWRPLDLQSCRWQSGCFWQQMNSTSLKLFLISLLVWINLCWICDAGSHYQYLHVHLFQASCKGINDSL